MRGGIISSPKSNDEVRQIGLERYQYGDETSKNNSSGDKAPSSGSWNQLWTHNSSDEVFDRLRAIDDGYEEYPPCEVQRSKP